MKRWIDDVGFPSQRRKRPEIIMRSTRSTITTFDAREHHSKHAMVRQLHKASLNHHRYEPLGKIANVPELFRTYKSICPGSKAKSKNIASKSQNEISFSDDYNAQSCLIDHSATERLKDLCDQKWTSRNANLEKEIEKSNQRIHYTRAGSGILCAFTNPNSRRGEAFSKSGPNSPRVTATPKMLRPIRLFNETLDSGRNISLEEKLRFYDESPRNLERRIETSHCPWDESPRISQVRDTFKGNRKNNKLLTVPETSQINERIERQRKNTEMPRIFHHTSWLGNEGKEILMAIIEDEKHNVKASETERKRLATIIQENLKKKNKKKPVVEFEVDTELADTIRNNAQHSRILIDKFFSYSYNHKSLYNMANRKIVRTDLNKLSYRTKAVRSAINNRAERLAQQNLFSIYNEKVYNEKYRQSPTRSQKKFTNVQILKKFQSYKFDDKVDQLVHKILNAEKERWKPTSLSPIPIQDNKSSKKILKTRVKKLMHDATPIITKQNIKRRIVELTPPDYLLTPLKDYSQGMDSPTSCSQSTVSAIIASKSSSTLRQDVSRRQLLPSSPASHLSKIFVLTPTPHPPNYSPRKDFSKKRGKRLAGDLSARSYRQMAEESVSVNRSISQLRNVGILDSRKPSLKPIIL